MKESDMGTCSSRIRGLLAASVLSGLTDDEIETLFERSDAAYWQFHSLELSAEERRRFIFAISSSNDLLLSLTRGNWSEAALILRDIAAKTEPDDYRRIIVQLTIQTPHGLEGSLEFKGDAMTVVA